MLTSVFEDNFDREPQREVDAFAIPLLPRIDGSSTGVDGVRGDAGPFAVEGGASPLTGVERLRADASLLDGGFGRGARRDGAPIGWPSATTSLLPVRDESGLGPNWRQAQTSAWRIEKGRLCGQGAKNHGVWLVRELPTNARIEFDAMSDSLEGDLKAELWGDGQSAATTISYENATSYLAILGGWKNSLHVLARINEHGDDRKIIRVDKTSDDARQRPVNRGQTYHFKVERTDGATVRWSVDGLEYLAYHDPNPLKGVGHDHFGFNDWEARVCFDNVKVTPLP